MRSATEYLIATRQAERALKAGNCAPIFRLRDQRAATTKLALGGASLKSPQPADPIDHVTG